MATRFTLPFADVGNGIAPSDGAELFFFDTNSSNKRLTWNDAGENTKNSNPVVADDDGLFPAIFINGTYNVTLKDKDGTQIWNEDPITSDVSERTVTSIADGKALKGLQDDQLVFTTGYYVSGDGGGNAYYFDSTSAATVNTGNTFDMDDGVGQLLAVDPVVKNVLQWGGKDDGTTDVSSIANPAMVILKALGGGDMYFPTTSVSYYISSTLILQTGVNLIGDGGLSSTLRIDNVDGLNLDAIDLSDSSFNKTTIKGLYLLGVNGTTRTAITRPGSSTNLDQMFGLDIIDNHSQGWNITCFIKSVRNFRIMDNWFDNCNTGIKLIGLSLSGRIKNNHIYFGTGNGSGQSDGVLLDAFVYDEGTAKPEGISITDNDIHNFDDCVNLNNAVAFSVEGNEILSKVTGVKYSTVSGNINIKNNYLQINGTAGAFAVFGAGLSSINAGVSINISGNHCLATGTTDCEGIQLDLISNSNQSYTNITENSMSGMNNYDIALFNVGTVNVQRNMCFSNNTESLRISGLLPGHQITIDGNFFTGTILQAFQGTQGQIIVGANTGTFSTLVKGTSFILTADGTSKSFPFAALTGNIDDSGTTDSTRVNELEHVIADAGGVTDATTANELVHVTADSGTTDTTTANELEDTTQDFTATVSVGDVVRNTTDTTTATVTGVTNAASGRLGLSADIMETGEDYVIDKNFSSRVSVGDVVRNTTDTTTATVTSIANASAGRLVLDADIMTTGESYVIDIDFTSRVGVGDVVHNTTDSSMAVVTSVANASDGRLVLDADIMTAGEDYEIWSQGIKRLPTRSISGFEPRLLIGGSNDNTADPVITGVARPDGLGVDLFMSAVSSGTTEIIWEAGLQQKWLDD